ncbi:hypothetical protein [Methylobacterium sp. Leaf456]|uniref:helix-turn-helix domain-containing protein n=1 Tax=Methylobacterium sp. Leaf456 TaxID=1736382 RepID=UPI00138F728E|nr:hypothetical protein [Methylobacterium sp. Leaf456]
MKEALARRDAIPAADSVRSGSPIRLRLKRAGEIARPVDLARLLTRHGLSLKRAHATLNRITADEAVAVRLWSEAPNDVPSQFRALGVEASPLTIPKVDTRAIRARLGLSQADFAVRFGFELDTVQNWDQGRHAPDPATRVLLAIIDRDPALVEAVMIDAGKPERTPA